MILASISSLSHLSMRSLKSIHDSIHNGLDDASTPFLRWYHNQLVDEFRRRNAAYAECKTIHDNSFIEEYIISTGNYSDHSHTSMVDAFGNGFTDPTDGHYHIVSNGVVLEAAGHNHSLELTIEKHESTINFANDEFVEYLLGNLDHFSVIKMLSSETDDHHHDVFVLTGETGRTNKVNGHFHLVNGDSISVSEKHTHSLMPGSVKYIFQQQVKSSYENPVVRAVALNKTSEHRISIESAWDAFGGNNLIITPVIRGLEVCAVVEDIDGISVKITHGERDITHLFKDVSDALRFINMRENRRIVLSGVLTTRSHRESAEQTLLNVEQKTGIGVLYVETCGETDSSLSNEYHRHLAENALAGATLPQLKLLPRTVASEQEKVFRVSERAMDFEGAVGVRWRLADKTFGSESDNFVIYKNDA